MKKLLSIALTTFCFSAYAQLSVKDCHNWMKDTEYYVYSYQKGFVGMEGVGAPAILTPDGGMIVTGGRNGEGYEYRDIAVVIKFDAAMDTVWRQDLTPNGKGGEPQCIIQDKKGNTYVFTIDYHIHSEGVKGQSRIVMINAKGKVKWDMLLHNKGKVRNPSFTKASLAENGMDILIEGWVYPDERLVSVPYTAKINHKGKFSESYAVAKSE
jgi:hypothetical protein